MSNTFINHKPSSTTKNNDGTESLKIMNITFMNLLNKNNNNNNYKGKGKAEKEKNKK
ncbi:MAG TPA: hypothetical protein VF084_06030 [Nitrososphaeraceae archaeon]|jgi:hypothetical protein